MRYRAKTMKTAYQDGKRVSLRLQGEVPVYPEGVTQQPRKRKASYPCWIEKCTKQPRHYLGYDDGERDYEEAARILWEMSTDDESSSDDDEEDLAVTPAKSDDTEDDDDSESDIECLPLDDLDDTAVWDEDNRVYAKIKLESAAEREEMAIGEPPAPPRILPLVRMPTLIHQLGNNQACMKCYHDIAFLHDGMYYCDDCYNEKVGYNEKVAQRERRNNNNETIFFF